MTGDRLDRIEAEAREFLDLRFPREPKMPAASLYSFEEGQALAGYVLALVRVARAAETLVDELQRSPALDGWPQRYRVTSLREALAALNKEPA